MIGYSVLVLAMGCWGGSSNRGVDPGKKAHVLDLNREKYGDFGPTLACESLVKEDEQEVGVETLRKSNGNNPVIGTTAMLNRYA